MRISNCRQGDPISPIIFNIVINPVIKKLEGLGLARVEWVPCNAHGLCGRCGDGNCVGSGNGAGLGCGEML